MIDLFENRHDREMSQRNFFYLASTFFMLFCFCNSARYSTSRNFLLSLAFGWNWVTFKVTDPRSSEMVHYQFTTIANSSSRWTSSWSKSFILPIWESQNGPLRDCWWKPSDNWLSYSLTWTWSPCRFQLFHYLIDHQLIHYLQYILGRSYRMVHTVWTKPALFSQKT